MDDYNHYVLGTGNPLHPDNREPQEDFNSDNLTECLNYYKDFDDIVPLENAIYIAESKIKKAINDLDHIIIGCRTAGFRETANALCEVRENLKR